MEGWPSRRFECLTAALALGGSLTVGLVGARVEAAASQTAGCGAARFLAVTGEAFAEPRYATDAAAAEALCRAAGAAIVMAAATSRWRARAPRRGLPPGWPRGYPRHQPGRGEWSAGPHPLVLPPAHGSRASRRERPWVILLDSGCVAPWSGPRRKPPAWNPWRSPWPETAHHGHRRAAPKADEQTIRPDAKLLFVAGAGWTKKPRPTEAVHAAEAETLIWISAVWPRHPWGGSKSLVGDLSGDRRGGACGGMTHLNQNRPDRLGRRGHAKGSFHVLPRRGSRTSWVGASSKPAPRHSPGCHCGWARGKPNVLNRRRTGVE